MHDDRSLIEERLDRALRQRIRPAVYGEAVPFELAAWHAPGEPVPVSEALAAHYQPVAVGDRWGRPWGTTWFRLSGQVPAEWDGQRVEGVVDLGFGAGPGFSAEGLVYTPDGSPIKGVSPRNTYLPLTGWNSGGSSTVRTPAVAGADVAFYIEAAANPLILRDFLPTPLGDQATAGTDPLFTLQRADLVVFHADVWNLVLDLEVLGGLMRELSPHEPRRHGLLRALERALDTLDYSNVPATAAAARAQLLDVLASPAHASAHQLTAVGHAHIDTAWLWPIRETVRKVGRTMSNVTALAADNPEFVFVFSQAQQHEWLKSAYPTVFERVRQAVADGQVVPTGSQWVEPDGNVPSGEAMVRQIVYGKRFFLEEYGVETRDIWLPDSFGYSAAFPQIARLAGVRWFLTQKISWNQTNTFPHHTFWWEGIDGTQVFTHFPPIDTYNASLAPSELMHAQRNFNEHGRATRSLVPFGYGDGGGGPTREMLSTIGRVADLEGAPRVVSETPEAFFAAAEAEYPDAPVWSGELYLEKHRGTFTSQAKTKLGNRRSENLLREAELWATTAAVEGKLDYPYEELEQLWKSALLNQFHDILPGSSIAWVHQDAEALYAKIAADLDAIVNRSIQSLAGDGDQPITFNAAPHSRHQVPALGAGPTAIGDEGAAGDTAAGPVWVRGEGADTVLDNGLLRVTVDGRGLVTSIVDLRADRQVLPPHSVANLLQLHVDTPNQWDAWDVDAFYRNSVTDLTELGDGGSVEIVEDGGRTGAVQVRRFFGASQVVTTLRLAAGAHRLDVDNELDWRETEKFLKAAFPLDVHADRSASEIQFGHVYRPTHTNTSWDAARFEICAHRWIHVGETGYGVALVNDSKYGHDVTRTTRSDGGTTTTVRLSLLKAPLCPDPGADQGVQRFAYALVPGAGIPEAIEEGYRINLPERTVTGSGEVAPLVSCDNPAIVVEAVKLADDRSGDVVVRLYEAHGGQARGRLRTSFGLAAAHETDLLERVTGGHEVSADGVDLHLRPFQIRTVRLRGR